MSVMVMPSSGFPIEDLEVPSQVSGGRESSHHEVAAAGADDPAYRRTATGITARATHELAQDSGDLDQVVPAV